MQKSKMSDVRGRIMDVHNKIEHHLEDPQKDAILQKYLTMKNKLSFQYFKNELEGMRQEKDNAALQVADQKKQRIYDLEEITIMNMQNNELRKKIQKLGQETA